jgi:hypothetical protein
MAVYSTCIGCAVDHSGCQRRSEVRDQIAGLGVTELKFRCPARTPHFQVGERVIWSPIIWDEDEADYEAEFNATILREFKRGRYLIKADAGLDRTEEVEAPGCLRSGSLYATAPIHKLRKNPDDIAPRPVCPICQGTDDVAEQCHKRGYAPLKGCLRDTTPQSNGETG